MTRSIKLLELLYLVYWQRASNFRDGSGSLLRCAILSYRKVLWAIERNLDGYPYSGLPGILIIRASRQHMTKVR